jgi:putative tryptophan/tyrosine transport system substrate-binding protein
VIAKRWWTAVMVLCLVLLGCVQQSTAPKRFRIGVLNSSPAIEPVFDGFKARMTELGYIEGRQVEYRYNGPMAAADGTLEAEARAMAEEGIDLSLAITTDAATVAQQVFEDVPVVFWVIVDPVEAGYVESLNRPGGNMTGVTIGVEGTASEGRRLDLLKQMVPDIERVLIPYNPDDPRVRAQGLETVEAVAASLGIELVLQELRTPEEAAAMAASIPEDVDAVYILFADRVVMPTSGAWIESATERGIPVSMLNSGGVYNGALMSFGTEFLRIGEQIARQADLILKGTNVADIPVEVPEFYLSVNLQTAETIGLEIPDSILRQADLIVRGDETPVG